MKNIISISILAVSAIYADLSMDQIRNMVQKIHDKREGIGIETLRDTKEPFVRLKKEEDSNTTSYIVEVNKKEETKLSLNAILNERAYINGEWKKIDDNISGYTLKYIGKKGVILRSRNEIKKLFFHTKRENFITIKEGR